MSAWRVLGAPVPLICPPQEVSTRTWGILGTPHEALRSSMHFELFGCGPPTPIRCRGCSMQ
eukprot:2119684-Alexandrium_andersonii.AAC.1